MCILCYTSIACRTYAWYYCISTPEGLRGKYYRCSFIRINSMNTQELGNFVRNWVHYDNLASSLSKQTQNARKIRDTFENKSLEDLRTHNMESAVIQIQGGRLLVAEERHNQPLTYTRLEESLKAFFIEKQKAAGRPIVDDTAAILKFMKSHREVEVVKKLKKQASVPPLPPLPPPT